MPDYYCLFGPLVRLIEPEAAHALALGALKRNLVPRPPAFEDAALPITLWGREFANPIGLAAGFDKNAEVVDAMLAQGFGFVEVGSVTPLPQPGSPLPRLFRLPADGAVINRMGFNNQGQEVVARRLKARPQVGMVGVNLGKNLDSEDTTADYVEGVGALAGLADYLVINVSSPNTPGLRELQGREPLAALIGAVKRALPEPPPPLLLKIAPDLSEDDKRDIAEVALETGIDGIVATNTTIQRPRGLIDRHRAEGGGLSGRPLRDGSTAVLADIYHLTAGEIPLIGVGGIESGADAYAKIRAGASLVQLYTALVYHGPGIANRIKRQLAGLLKADGFDRVADAVGADHR